MKIEFDLRELKIVFKVGKAEITIQVKLKR